MASSSEINQLVVVIAAVDQINDLSKKLNQSSFYFTRIDSTSGLIEEATVCLLIGMNAGRYAELIELVEICCQPRSRFIPTGFDSQFQMQMQPMIEAQVGGALVYTLDIDHFEHL